MYKFPAVTPKDSEQDVVDLQNYLLSEAESLLGDRDQAKIILPTRFHDGGPCIMNSYDGKGAWAVLSANAAGYWPTTLYELAHETVHLLNPVVGYTNYLEEGVAVAFSVDMSKTQTTHPMSPCDQFYSKAYELVQKLPNGVYESAKQIRAQCGSLGAASPAALIQLFPELDVQLIEDLCNECNFT